MGSILRTLWLAAAFLLAGPTAVHAAGPGGQPEALAASSQCIFVLSDTWEATTAVLRTFSRSASGAWQTTGLETSVLLGRSGLGWGRGRHPEQAQGPHKAEGDGRSPAGIFELGPAFGLSQPEPALKSYPFYVLTPETVCVDDGLSRLYNVMFESPQAPKHDWTSQEQMLRPDGQYDLGLVVLHNVAPAVPGGGSCIFMHLQTPTPAPTSGCTSMLRPAMERLLAWLDAAKQPLLVQLPKAEYERLKTAWGLP